MYPFDDVYSNVTVSTGPFGVVLYTGAQAAYANGQVTVTGGALVPGSGVDPAAPFELGASYKISNRAQNLDLVGTFVAYNAQGAQFTA